MESACFLMKREQISSPVNQILQATLPSVMDASAPPLLPCSLPLSLNAASDLSSTTKFSRKRQDEKPREIAPFLRNLRKMLDEESQDIIRWTEDGRAFEIHDMERMMEFVLPKYFKHRKYTSFQRQLNYFNFKKWTKSKAVVCTFSNEYFLRDNIDSAIKISRKKSVNVPGTRIHLKRRINKLRYTSGIIRRPFLFNRTLPSPPPQDLQFPSLWKSDAMAISIPNLIQKNVSYPDNTPSYPSPTDVDSILQEYDASTLDMGSCSAYHGENTVETSLDYFDWIDQILPTLDQDRMDQGSRMDAFKHSLPCISAAESYYSPFEIATKNGYNIKTK